MGGKSAKHLEIFPLLPIPADSNQQSVSQLIPSCYWRPTLEHAHAGMFLEDFYLDTRIKQIDDLCKSLSNEERNTQYVLFNKEDKRLYIDSKIWKKL